MKSKIIIALCLALLVVASYCNWKLEVIAINPFYANWQHDLKVMTWNVHCSDGTDDLRQRRIAALILEVDADFVLLKEYNQDSCLVTDSILRTRFPYTVEHHSHKKCGDIFYSKRNVYNSGYIYPHIQGKGLHPIKTTIAYGRDSIQIFGVHLMSNQNYNSNLGKGNGSGDNNNLSLAKYKDGQLLKCFQAECTKNEILKSKHAVIVMGDMNDFNQSQPLEILTSSRLRDSWWEGGFGYGATYHEGWLRLRIDYILHSDKLKLQDIRVIETNLSDHNPLVAEFNISK